MAGVVFPNIGNALLPLIQMDRQKERDERDFSQRTQERADNLAFRRDESKYRRESLDEQRAMRIQSHMATMDEKKRAMVQDFAKFRVQAGGAVLAAPPEQRPQAYAMYVQAAKERGYDMSLFPQQWDPSTERRLQFDVDQSIPWADRPQAMPAPGGGAPAPGGAPGPPGDVLARSGNAISGIESAGQPNGGYGAIGPVAKSNGSRAYGKYQVMDFNVGPWTAEVLGKPMTPQEFLANPQAQDAVFKTKFGQLVQKYGPEGASRAWFAGEGGMNNPNAADVNGMTVAKYGEKFNKGFGGPQVADAGGFTPTNTPAQSVPGALPQMPAQGGGEPGQGDVMAPPRAAPPSIGNEVDDLRRQTRANGGDIFTVKGQPEIQNGNYVVRSLQNPRQIVGMVPVKQKELGAGGLFPGNSVEANALNQLVQRGVLSEQQALELAAGKTITNPATGQVEFKRPTELVGSGALTPPKQMTEGQSAAALYADRMEAAEKIIANTEQAALNPAGKMLEKVPLGNYLQPEAYQKFEQARRNFINATLRRESGAVISEEEFKNAEIQYFARPGDSEGVLKQKAENRRDAIEGIKRAAGPSYKPAPAAAAKPSAASAPKVGEVQDGYLFKGGDPSQPSSWEKVR